MTDEPRQNDEDLISLDEAVKLLDISKSTFYRFMSQGDLKGVKVGRQWRFRKTDLTAYMERSPTASTVPAGARADVDNELQFMRSALEREDLGDIAGSLDPAGKTLEVKVSDLANGILALAAQANATDIHLEAFNRSSRLRNRIDGVLHVIREIPATLHESLVGRFKEMGDMHVNEKRLPQDGRFIYPFENRELDVRVCTLPASHGESLVMRLLNHSAALGGIASLGMSDEDLGKILLCLNRPGGLILAAGPSGSGKSTFLYACLMELQSPQIKMLTVEEPIEFELPNIVQAQVRSRLGLTMEAGVRTSLRQDPDVVMVGRIEDRSITEVVLQGGLAGTGMLAAIHADNALAALSRLNEMGLERHLLTSGLNGIVASRLCRLLCPHCKTEMGEEGSRVRAHSLAYVSGRCGYAIPDGAIFYRPVGCDRCRGTGYSGRTALFEVLILEPQLTARLLKSASLEEMTQIALQSGMKSLLADGLRRAVDGDTSVEEVLRVTDTHM